MKNISIRKMRILLASAEEGSFTRAAMRENISQPAATIIINEIEETLKQSLFVRQGAVRKAELTPAGMIVAETFSRIVAGYDMELEKISSVQRNRRSVRRVMIQHAFFEIIEPEWIYALVDLLSGERLLLEEGHRDQIIENVSLRDADIGIIEGSLESKRCDIRGLTTSMLGLAVPHGSAFAAEPCGTIGWNEVPEECYVFSGVSEPTMRAINRSLVAVGRSIDDMHVVNALSGIRAMAQARPLPVLLPHALAGRLQGRHKFRFLAFSPTSVQCQLSLITPWGYINQINMNALRGRPCVVQTPDVDSGSVVKGTDWVP